MIDPIIMDVGFASPGYHVRMEYRSKQLSDSRKGKNGVSKGYEGTENGINRRKPDG